MSKVTPRPTKSHSSPKASDVSKAAARKRNTERAAKRLKADPSSARSYKGKGGK